MARTHLIEHRDGGKWLAQHGFVSAREGAMRFPSEQDAKQYLQDNPLLKEAGHKATVHEVDEVVGRFGNQARTDYDPWGYNRYER